MSKIIQLKLPINLIDVYLNAFKHKFDKKNDSVSYFWN